MFYCLLYLTLPLLFCHTHSSIEYSHPMVKLLRYWSLKKPGYGRHLLRWEQINRQRMLNLALMELKLLMVSPWMCNILFVIIENFPIILYSYYSTLKSVTFLNNNCGGVDYRQLKQHNVERKKLQLNQSSTLNWEY
jgi:hypothetical protein